MSYLRARRRGGKGEGGRRIGVDWELETYPSVFRPILCVGPSSAKGRA